jgi:hypothetical protein
MHAPYLGPEEVLLDREHGDDGEHLRGAAQVHRDQHHLGQGRVQRELDHVAPQRSQRPRVVQRSQHPQLVHTLQSASPPGNTPWFQNRDSGRPNVSVVEATGMREISNLGHVVLWRRIHKVEVTQVIFAQRLEQQDDVGQVRALDLGHRGGQQLVLEARLGVAYRGRRGK